MMKQKLKKIREKKKIFKVQKNNISRGERKYISQRFILGESW